MICSVFKTWKESCPENTTLTSSMIMVISRLDRRAKETLSRGGVKEDGNVKGSSRAVVQAIDCSWVSGDVYLVRKLLVMKSLGTPMDLRPRSLDIAASTSVLLDDRWRC